MQMDFAKWLYLWSNIQLTIERGKSNLEREGFCALKFSCNVVIFYEFRELYAILDLYMKIVPQKRESFARDRHAIASNSYRLIIRYD